MNERRPILSRQDRRVALLLPALALTGCAVASAPAGALTPGPTRTPIQLGPTSTAEPTTIPRPTAEPSATAVPLPEVTGDDWSLGPEAAPVVFLVYSDFQSPNAALGLQALFEAYDRHPDEIRVVLRHFPVLPRYDKDSLAGQAVEAAGRQGLFWQMARTLAFARDEWAVLSPEGFHEWLQEQAALVGLDPDEFAADLASGRFAALMLEAFQEATAAGIPGVPTVLLNGVPLRISPTPLDLEFAVRLELLAQSQYPAPPAMTIDANLGYTATLETEAGDILIQLLPESAPLAVNSFVSLASKGWFDGMEIHRVEPGVLVETGDPSGTGFGDPGYHLPDEIDPRLTFDRPGMVALMSAGPGTGGSRFFINLQPLPDLTGSRTIFGRVLDGLDLLESLEARDPAQDLLISGAAVIRRVRVETTE
jgi:cyclophilin family peptidyl-prolyl cis-trans isomerase/protein-disulfide isomerase